MNPFSLRAATPDDTPAILAMNDAVVELTSPMDETRLANIVAFGASVQLAWHEDQAAGFLITLPPQCDYDSVNYQWFNARFRNFLYVDRIVIDSTLRQAGIGNQIYQHTIAAATDKQIHWLAAEMNLNPPNEISMAFHRKHGFIAVGEQQLGSGKSVSMQVRPLA